MIDPELGFNKGAFQTSIRNKKRKGILPKHIIELAESIPNWSWDFIYNWVSLDEFIQWCKDNKIKNYRHFYKWCQKNQKPDNIPYEPDKQYDNFSWSYISDFWKNKGKTASKEEFIEWCKDNKINSQTIFIEWKKNNKRPDNIPGCPYTSYDDWSWSDISGYIINVNWVSLDEFIQWCKNNGIKSHPMFNKWCKENTKPDNIPSTPSNIYKNWSWSLISNYIDSRLREYVNEEEFIQWCKDNKIRTKKDLKNFNRPNNIPSTPQRAYKNWSWKKIPNLKRNKIFCNINELIIWCKKNGIKSKSQFGKWCKENNRPDNIPSTPQKVYENWSWKLVN